MKKFLLLCFSFGFALSVWAQDRVVTGRVTADDGSALPGVNVVVKGTTNGTVTDAEGGFKLSVPSAGGVLVFSFIGMTTMEEEIGARSVIDLQMKADAKQLQEVVVNAIGETVAKDKLGVAAATVSGGSVVSSGETGLINGLAGKAAGLNIIRNGSDPGAGAYIQLRGQSTIGGDLQPLIVIDGMPMFNSFNSDGGNQTAGVQQQSRLNDLNPSDIASVEILKSASSAALWGSRAANGVIMITTKKGKANQNGKVDITYNGTLSFDEVNKVPALQTTFGQGHDSKYNYNGRVSWGDRISDRPGTAENPTVWINSGYVKFADGNKRYRLDDVYSGSGLQTNPWGEKTSKKVYDHEKEVFQTGHSVEHGLNLSGGNDRSQFYVSYSNLDQQGIIKHNSDYKRNTARINASTALTDKVHVSTNISYTNVRSNRIQQGSNLGGIFLGGLRTPADFDNSYTEGTYYDASGIPTQHKQVSYRNAIGSKSNPGYDNPLWTIDHNKSFNVVNRILGNVELVYDVNSWLSLKGNAGVDTYAERRTDYVNAQSAISPGGYYREQTIGESQWNTNLFATGKKKFSDNFNLVAILGFNYNSRQYNGVSALGRNFIVPDAPPDLSNTDPANRSISNSSITQRTSAGFAQVSTDLFDQVYVTLTGRAESASTFGPQAKSLFFYPSATAAWVFTKAIGTNPILSFGKVRASYGIVGRQPDPYVNLTQYYAANFFESWGATLNGANSIYGGGFAISTTVGNPKIRPERKHEFETGLDLRFWDNRISFSGTAFYNKTTDVILQPNVSPSSGFANTTANAGEIENKGLELSLEPTWIKSAKGLSWSTSFIWYAYRNYVTNVAGAESIFLTGGGFSDGSSRAVKGQPLGVLWGTYYDKSGPNNSYVLDANGFPKLAPAEGVLGNPNPQYRMSIGNTLRYKGFTLYALVDFQVGGQMWNGTRGALMYFGKAKNSGIQTTVSAADAASIKTYDGATVATAGRSYTNPDGSVTFRGTVANYGGGKVAQDEYWYSNNGGGFNVNGPYVEDAAWTRLREVTLSYSLPSEMLKKAKLKAVSLGVTGRNLYLWTNYSGIDPETNLTGANNGRGLDYFQNPNTKSVLFKLSITY